MCLKLPVIPDPGANLEIPLIVFNQVVNSDEYARYCETYKVQDKESDKEIFMFLMWKSFGNSI